MEEDIKVLEELNKQLREGKIIITLHKENFNYLPYVENLIKGYKKLEKRSDIINSQNIKYQNTLEKLQKETIWKSKVREKIEELSEDLEIMKVDAMYGRYKEYGSKLSFEKQFIYKYGMHDVLQVLLEE